MLTHYKYILFCLIAMPLCIGVACAAGAGVGGTCTSSDQCGIGLYCRTYDEGATPYQVCSFCTNGPKDQNGKDCDDKDSDSLCKYTNHGYDTNEDNCPWQLECRAPYYLYKDPNDTDKYYCQTCEPHYTLNCYLDEVCIDGTNLGTLKYGSTGYQTENMNSGLECVANLYTVNIDDNYDGATTQYIFEQYETAWLEYGELHQLNFPPQITKMPIPHHPELRKFLGYFTEKTGGTQVFDENGSPIDEHPTIFTSDGNTLYAHWSDTEYVKYSIGWDDIQRGFSYYANCTQGLTCDISGWKQISCGTDEEGLIMDQMTSNNEFGTLNGNVFTLNTSGVNSIYQQIDQSGNGNGARLTVGNITFKDCPEGYYCVDCEQYKCPNGSTSGSGQSDSNSCYWGSGTQFVDSNGGFTIPVTSKFIMSKAVMDLTQ